MLHRQNEIDSKIMSSVLFSEPEKLVSEPHGFPPNRMRSSTVHIF